MAQQVRRCFDYSLKMAVVKSGNPSLFSEMKIHRNSRRNWKKKGVKIPEGAIPNNELVELRIKVATLGNELKRLRAEVALGNSARKITSQNPDWKRTDESQKGAILELANTYVPVLGLSKTLSVLGLPRSRYKRWRRLARCPVPAEKRPCAAPSPSQLTAKEVAIMGKLVASRKYAHFSIASLAIYAQRTGILFACRHTWYKYIRKNGWTRHRVPKDLKKYLKGISAEKNHPIWHVDVSHYKLQNGMTYYIQAVIDNYSRYVLAWRVSKNATGINTVALLRQAVFRAFELKLITAELLYMDPGPENVNHNVSEFLAGQKGCLERVLAQVDVRFSNARVESLFRSLKNNYL